MARKTEQDNKHHQIYNLKRKYEDTVLRNLETNKACAVLAHEIKQLRREAKELGVVLSEDAPEDEHAMQE